MLRAAYLRGLHLRRWLAALDESINDQMLTRRLWPRQVLQEDYYHHARAYNYTRHLWWLHVPNILLDSPDAWDNLVPYWLQQRSMLLANSHDDTMPNNNCGSGYCCDPLHNSCDALVLSKCRWQDPGEKDC